MSLSLEKIRSQPTQRKRLIAFAAALAITGVIFVVWLSLRLSQTPDNQPHVAQDNQQSFQTPKDTFVQNFSALWSSIGTEYDQLKSAVGTLDMYSSAQYQASTTSPSTTAPIPAPTYPASAPFSTSTTPLAQ